MMCTQELAVLTDESLPIEWQSTLSTGEAVPVIRLVLID